MRKKHFLSIALFMTGICSALPHAWINEIHYDNAGTDRNEFVEVVVESPENCFLGDLALYMYNGHDGKPYCLDTIDEFDAGEIRGPFHFYVWFQRGIQNDKEGMVLVYRDTILDILAYEGSFTGVNSPAAGVLFPDIGIHESGNGPDTNALYLSAMPGSEWQYGASTPGMLNTDQILSETPMPVRIKDFNARYREDHILISWTSESETENAGFNLYKNGAFFRFIEGRGTCSDPFAYRVSDTGFSPGMRITYCLADIDRGMNESFLDSLTLSIPPQDEISIGEPYPNPANSACKLPVRITRDTKLTIDLFNVRGQRLSSVFDDLLSCGKYEFSLEMAPYPSGTYIIAFKTEKHSETREFIHLK